MNTPANPATLLIVHLPGHKPKFYIDFMLTAGDLLRLPVYDCLVKYNVGDVGEVYDFDKALTADSVRSQLILAMVKSEYFPEDYVRHYADEVLTCMPDRHIMNNLFFYQ